MAHLSFEERLKELAKLARDRSYRQGDFTLASGKKSSFYLDMKATTLDPRGATLIGEVAFELVSRERLEIQAVGGLTLGADPLATALSLTAFSRGVRWAAFIVRKEPKDHGTSRYIEGSENLPKGAKVLVLEDVVTTGGSSLKAIDRLREEGFDPVATLTVVDREEGGRESIQAAGLRFLRLLSFKQVIEAS